MGPRPLANRDARHSETTARFARGRSRFVVIAERDIHGRLAWRVVQDGNHDSKAGQLRHRRCLQCDAYARVVEVLRHGRRGVQADLFCRSG